MTRQARSPGKLILSGEHSVVQGCPALAMAIDLEATADFTSLAEPHLRITLPAREPRIFPLEKLKSLLSKIRKAHASFLRGECAFTQVAQNPEELLAICAGLSGLSSGASLRFESELPLGAGLGSSAAFILTLLKVLEPKRPNSELQKLAIEGENFQHGRSSGLDVAVSLQGGLLAFEQGHGRPVSMQPPLPPFQVYHSGSPQSSTGECVEQSRKIFRNAPSLKEDFRHVTHQTQQALQARDLKAWQDCVRENHQLLCQLGVVPPAVQKVISRLEESGSAAKVCGAGTVRGNTAGMILVLGDNPKPLPESWQALPLKLSRNGTRILP
ncbi:hypothetical protein P0Y35_04815 [Kiritimatiellaeota bacterium B1221]|nr:hypothetical protein [Kiritimatiellaeota bacterium B1221]